MRGYVAKHFVVGLERRKKIPDDDYPRCEWQDETEMMLKVQAEFCTSV